MRNSRVLDNKANKEGNSRGVLRLCCFFNYPNMDVYKRVSSNVK